MRSQEANSRSDQRLDLARTRLLAGGALFALAFMTVGVRLANLAIAPEPEANRFVSGREVAHLESFGRGEIVDRKGELLATNLRTASVFANPRKVKNPREAAARLVAALPELSEAEVAAGLSSDRSFIWLKRGLTPAQQFEVNRLGIPGVDFEHEDRRVYPYGALTAHVLGFTDVDSRGLAGVEQSFDQMLSEQGSQLRLSIDVRVQEIVRQEIARQALGFDALGAGGIVMDATNGEILALVSLPDFDPNAPGEASEEARFNRVSLGVYELGSVFKIFNHALALDSGVASMSSFYDATKPIRVSRFAISDYHPENRWLSVPEIFMHSSNIGSARMALDVGTEAQRRFMGALGMLRKTSVELPEQGRPMFPDPWREVNTMTISFGHGIAVSPLHLVAGVAATVNGGVLYPPTLVRHDENEVLLGTQVISAETSAEMRRLLRLVVAEGTGQKGDAPGYFVGGKTGTAEKLEDGRYKRKALISSFVAAFPIHDPQYVVYVMLDEPQGTKESYGFATGGWTAAPAVSRIIERTALALGMPPNAELTPELREALTVRVSGRE